MSDSIGPQVIDPYRGWLVFQCLPPDLQRAEDSTQAADFTRDPRRMTRYYDRDERVAYWLRDATAAEQALLTHLGYTLPAEGDDDYPLQTWVSYATGTLRRRTWPALETDDDEKDETHG